MPGLINAHAHLNDGDETLPLYDQLLAQLRLYAEYGVTTIHTLGDDGVESVRVRDEQERGDTLDRARLYVSGPNVVAETVEEARQNIDRVANMRVNIIKTRLNATPNDMTPEVYRALIDQAHQRRLRVAAHLVDLDDAKGLVDAGLDVVAHSVRDQDVDAKLISELTRLDVGYIPTLTRCLSVFLYENDTGILQRRVLPAGRRRVQSGHGADPGSRPPGEGAKQRASPSHEEDAGAGQAQPEAVGGWGCDDCHGDR